MPRHDTPAASQVDVPGLARSLRAVLTGDVQFDRASRAMHATDASVYQIIPLGVVTPRTRNDVEEVVRVCREHGVSITARGGGTSQAGQAIGAGISLDFSRYMNRVLDFDTAAATVTVEPGIVLDELNELLKPHGLQLPLDLSTSNRATIGGMIANNSAGTRSIIYGKTIDYVESVDVVFSDGSSASLGPLSEEALRSKLAQQDLEGAAYRAVQRLASELESEIRSRYPRILRRVGGYNLDEFIGGGEDGRSREPFNLARMLVGSEGTLGLTVAATMRLAPLPRRRVLCSVQFDDVLEAMRATPVILEHGPSAVELLDRFMLEKTDGRIEYAPLRGFIQGDPGAVLLVEFFGQSDEELAGKIESLQTDLEARGLGNYLYRALGAEEQALIWELRRAALGLTMSETGDAKAISFVEDTAVPPERLHDYIENFQKILTKYETQAGFYAHASVGLLHIRPVINLKSAQGVQRFEAIAGEVADLVLEYGGALSGEHGDGLVRAPFQEKMFGPVLYNAFCEVKSAFDPTNILNPGKIVHAPALTSNLRFEPAVGQGDMSEQEFPDAVRSGAVGDGTGRVDEEREYTTRFDFSDFGGLLRATEQCTGVGACRKTLTGTMCPSYMATRNEIDSTRGRANALRLALSGGLEATGFGDEELLPVLDLCLECKACKRECPTGVDMARLKSEFLHQYHGRHGASIKDRVLSRADRIARWGSRLAPLSNWLAATGPVRRVNEAVFGLDRRRPLPAFSGRPFTRRRRDSSPAFCAAEADVALFADTFNNYYEPEQLADALAVLQNCGAEVAVAPQVCCGRPLISKGFLDGAARQAAATTSALLPLAEGGIPILFCEPSCYSAVQDDHPRLLRGAGQEDARKVAAACQLVEEWAGPRMKPTRPGPSRVMVHGHCHQKALVGMQPLQKLLAAIPDCKVTVLDSGCCGLAGMFGYEHYDVSKAIGERRLLPAARELEENEILVSPGFSCRQQIRHFTGVQSQSPTSLLAALL
ncbi:MAG: FAD-binding protein [Caldilineaceae bacterium]|nr:FAD-binding protein [Caldilineaceae bacterium]